MNRDSQLELFEVFVYLPGNRVEGRYDPLVLGGEGGRKLVFNVEVVDVHVNIARGVPKLVGKAGASLDSLFGVADIISR